MRTPKIFVSHSSKANQNLELLEKVCNSLRSTEYGGEAFEVLVDQSIRPNEEWFPLIHEWLYECDAVVILLSNAALESRWVQAESMVMSVRRRNEQDFRLIVVPIDNVNETIINQHPIFGDVARLDDFQFIRGCKDEQDIICRVNEELAELRIQRTPFETLTQKIRESLDGICGSTLEEALTRLNCEYLPRFLPGRCRAEILARALLRTPQESLSNFRILLEELAHVIHRNVAYTLLNMISGIWVNAEAAACLVEARVRKKVVAINSYELEHFTGHCYARRAWPFPQNIILVSTGGSLNFMQIKSALISEMAKSVTNPKRAEQRLHDAKDPILLIFPLPDDREIFPDDELIARISKECPNVTIILAANAEDIDKIAFIDFLRPLLNDGEEDKQCRHYEDVIDYINHQMKWEKI